MVWVVVWLIFPPPDFNLKSSELGVRGLARVTCAHASKVVGSVFSLVGGVAYYQPWYGAILVIDCYQPDRLVGL